MSSGGKIETPKVTAKRHTLDDDPEPVGPGPQIVFNKSSKMSIYGPLFKFGPPQLRKQRLLDKMKKEADDALEKKIAEFKAAQAELDAQAHRQKMEEEAKQLELARQNQQRQDQAVQQMQREELERTQMQYALRNDYEITYGGPSNQYEQYNPMYNYKF